MDILKNKTDKELLDSILAEIAKSTNEVKCARQDLEKASSRLSFLIAVTNEMINRK
jgi:hypothetical protein